MNSSKISIITTSYNYEQFIGETIDSVIKQSYKNWELIIIDDASTDNSIEIIKPYTKNYSNISLYSNEKNNGLSYSIQKGLLKASGDYIAFLESDDYWAVNNLEEKINFIKENPNTNFLINRVEAIGKNPQICSDKKGYADYCVDIINSGEEQLVKFCEMNLVPTFSCVLAKKEVFNGLDFTPLYDQWLDWWIWFQVALKGHKICAINAPLTYWRIHDESYNYKFTLKKMDELKQKEIACKKALKNLLMESKSKGFGSL